MPITSAPMAAVDAGIRWRGAYFAAGAAILTLFTAASSVPSPLYVVYQQLWGFTPIVLTVVFAVYALGLLSSLLTVGALSDHVGRRPVLAGAILLEIVALVLFLLAGDAVSLSMARFLQGIATGAAMTTLGATLIDLESPTAPGRGGVVNAVAPTSGLTLGALACGALVEFGPSPTRLVYALLLGGMGLAAVVVSLMPETATRRPGALTSLRPRLGVPARLRAKVVPVVPVLIASWALGGLYLSLGPSVLAGQFGVRSHLAGGFVVALLCGTGSVTAFLLRNQPAMRLLAPAAILLGLGTLVTLLGMTNGLVVAAIGTLVAGAGFGAAAPATFGTFTRIAGPDERAALLAVAYVISYLAFSVPAMAAGFASTACGLRITAEVYALIIVALTVVALALRLAPTPAARRAGRFSS